MRTITAIAIICLLGFGCDKAPPSPATGSKQPTDVNAPFTDTELGLNQSDSTADAKIGPKQARSPKESVRFNDDFFSQVVVTPSGDVYTVGDGVWLIRDAVAVRVVKNTMIERLVITPSGDVYAFGIPPDGVWLIRGEVAMRVADGATLPPAKSATVGGGDRYAQAQIQNLASEVQNLGDKIDAIRK